MPVPISQAWTVASYVLGQKFRGNKRYPLVLMLEPLFRCNLACAGCGKIQYPDHVLNKRLTPEQCWAAADECGAPMVSIPGGEPLIHPEIDKIVEGLVARKKYIYLCTNALLLKRKIDLFKPTKYLTFSVHMDGLEPEHDAAVCRDGTYKIALEGIKEAVARGFRVTTNTTLFEGANPSRVREFFDEMMKLKVEGMMLSPGYSYQKAPDQDTSSDVIERRSYSMRFWPTEKNLGNSISPLTFSNSCKVTSITIVLLGEIPPTTSSVGRNLVTSSKTVTSPLSNNSCKTRLGSSTVKRVEMKNVATAWFTADTKPVQSTTPLDPSLALPGR